MESITELLIRRGTGSAKEFVIWDLHSVVDDDLNLQGYEAVLIFALFYFSYYNYQSTRSHISERIISVHSQLILEIASEC